jgi:DNA-binding MarR family transcriptional regulator
MTRHERIPIDPPAGGKAGQAGVDFGALNGFAGFMLRLAQVQVFEAFFHDLAADNATPGQIGILVAVERNPGIRQGVLADALRIKWSNTAKIIRYLEHDGLIERRVPASDRRAVELHLTPKGSALVRRILPKAIESDAAALAPLTNRERATLLRLLAKLTQPLGQP